ncbi:DEAD/DEAH box helicase family protein [Cellulomonas humilata]|uniref:Superfamily II DNA or RNA helicase n=1 Tax=Cellulomonas humilata TaxID=144055 RepID=A0ABU0EKZ6_9CELL|nr:DEAD/DEAH box helicase family protein [Cellulomonas humilata]MDQ0375963.1 superfamily II DNA or RNA helicase [Cellulomonas humilata]
MLRDLQNLQAHYSTGQDSLLDDFYVPCLKNSNRYDRATGYFSSALYAVTSAAYSQFVTAGGRIRLITSPQLSSEDVRALAEGAAAKRVGEDALRSELVLLLERPETAAPTRLLATMVATGVLDLRVALQPGAGIFHDKVGIFQDDEDRRVAFIGSANETFSGWGANHESIEVFASWEGTTDLARVRRLAAYFDRLWAGGEGEIEVLSLTEEMLDLLRENAHDSVEAALAATARRAAPSVGKKQLMDYQANVLESWKSADHHGIVSFATGAGKTITAIEGIRRWSAGEQDGATLIVVPSKDLHTQWARELRTELPEANLVLAGAGHSEWRGVIRWLLSDHAQDGRPRIVLATNKTFSSPQFQESIDSSRPDLLLVADELHRTGSPSVLRALQAGPFKATLGLSATYARQFDESGTQSLLEFYGPVLEPVIGLTEAILLGRLVPYDYFLHKTSLDDQEQEQYDKLTMDIKKVAGRESDTNAPDSYLQKLLIKRARILKQARAKVPAALAVLRAEFQEGDRWLVYCDDTNQLGAMVASCLEHGLPALEYHSDMTSRRDDVMASFGRRGGIIVAIRCLDEGIDIPACDRALIIASSTVEREYIQRRGRVLRTSVDKYSAAVHDMLLVDSAGGVLTRGEALRAQEFARLARNDAPTFELQHMLALSPDFGAEISAMMEGEDDE